MKKLLVFIALVAGVSSSSFAQAKFGVKGGVNISNFKMSSEGIDLNFDSKVGFLIGAFGQFQLSEPIVLQSELLFAQYGYRVDFQGEKGDVDLNYLSVPIIGKYYFGGFNVQAGPQVGILLSAKAKEDGGDSEDIKDDHKGLDLGLNIGAGYDLESGLGFDVRYYIGIANVLEDSEDVTGKNNGFQISVSYAF